MFCYLAGRGREASDGNRACGSSGEDQGAATLLNFTSRRRVFVEAVGVDAAEARVFHS